MKINDIDIDNWRDYDHIKTDSWWIGKFSTLRPKDFGDNKFHTRFHPEIPYQMMLRYTKIEETVWDMFGGSGTTIDVGKMLFRNVISNDLVSTRDDIIEADSTKWNPGLEIQLAIMHPPYWNMVNYNDDPENLCNGSLDDFLLKIELTILQINKVLQKNRFAVLIISDVYHNGEQIPLGSLCYPIFKSLGFVLKGYIVKDFGETKGTAKTNARTGSLWRYRALKSGFWNLGIDQIWVYKKVR